MKQKLMAVLAAATLTAGPALADLKIVDTSYRTGPYAANGIPFSDGYQDYFTLLNQRDGGIGGEKINLVECETGYNTEKGVECYEANKGGDALVFQPLSTGITYQLIPKATADQIPLHTMGYGRTSAKNGEVFRWVFNYPANYWDGASHAVTHILNENDGDISGKKIALVYHNSAYGKEPIRTLEELAKKHGYELTLLPVDHPGQEQKSQWLQIRRESPDYVIMWGWGVMNQVAIKEAAAIRFPMDKFIGVWWSGSENDVAPAGDAADKYLAGTMHAPGRDFDAINAILTHVYDKGNGGGERERVGEVLYNRGMLEAILTAEAIRNAVEIHGTKEIRGKHLRDGLEALDMTAEDFSRLGLEGFMKPFKLSCQDHEGGGPIAIQQWNAADQKWVMVSDWIEPMSDVIRALVKEDAEAFAKENNITPRTCS